MERNIIIFIIASLFSGCTHREEPVLLSDPGLKIPFSPEQYLCIKTTGPVIIDGDLGDDAWQKAPWSSPFVDIEGELQPLPEYDTRVKMAWDNNYLYIAAELTGPHIWARLTMHDTVIYHDDDFEVFIDPDGDTHNYYEFEINALNTGWDLLLTKPYRDGGQAIDSWEIPGLLKAVKIYGTLNDPADHDDKWCVELALPWEVLREYNTSQKIPERGDQWRINFSRVHWPVAVEGNRYIKMKDSTGNRLPANNRVWSPQGVIAMHQPETWGYVQFAENQNDTFSEHPDEKVKWALRQLYYRQRAYFNENKTFTANPASLRLHEVTITASSFEPEIILIPTGFIASHPSLEADGVWYITTDGLIRFARRAR